MARSMKGKQLTGVDTENSMSIPVKVQKMVLNKLISFKRVASEGAFDAKTGKLPQPAGYENLVEVTFEPLKPNETLVIITEGEWRFTEGGRVSSYQNCQGWMHMACCLKAYIEYGINLRKGSF
jgi:uncharacterized protein YndB with AHSA1/START domain